MSQAIPVKEKIDHSEIVCPRTYHINFVKLVFVPGYEDKTLVPDFSRRPAEKTLVITLR